MSKTKLAILVGGPADGRRVQLQPHCNYVNVAHRLALRPHGHPNVAECVPEYADHMQYREFFGDRDTLLLCPSTMHPDEAMARFMRGYQLEIAS
mgnify:CR=1 FL=1